MKPFDNLRITDVARWMGLSVSQLERLAEDIDDGFWPTRAQLVGKKVREIDAPKPKIKALLRRLHHGLQSARLYHAAAHGGVIRRSTFTSARQHLGHTYVGTRDAKDCFPSIKRESLHEELVTLGFRGRVASVLAKLLTVRGRVGQGSPVSTDAANLFLYRADQKIASRAGQLDAGRSRIVDDFVVSSDDLAVIDELTLIIEDELRQRGIRVNHKKRRQSGLQRSENEQLVHSLRVNLKDGVRICKAHLQKARRQGLEYENACRRVTPASLLALAQRRNEFFGLINYIAQADRSPEKQIRTYLTRGDSIVREKLARQRLTAHRNKWWVFNDRRNEPLRLANLWQERITHSAQVRIA